MILSKYLNKFTQSINRHTYLEIIIILLVLTTITSLLPNSLPYINSLTWFITLYLTTGYIKTYHLLNNSKHNLSRFLLFIGVGLASIILLNLTSNLIHFNTRYSTILVNAPSSILALISALELFAIFIKMKPFSNKHINVIASTTLSIYLIHDHFIVRSFLWSKAFNIKELSHSPLFPLEIIGIIATIFITCAIIDLIYQFTIERIWLKVSTPIYTKLALTFESHKKSTSNKIKKFLFP